MTLIELPVVSRTDRKTHLSDEHQECKSLHDRGFSYVRDAKAAVYRGALYILSPFHVYSFSLYRKVLRVSLIGQLASEPESTYNEETALSHEEVWD